MWMWMWMWMWRAETTDDSLHVRAAVPAHRTMFFEDSVSQSFSIGKKSELLYVSIWPSLLRQLQVLVYSYARVRIP